MPVSPPLLATPGIPAGCTLDSALKRLGSRFQTAPLDKSSPYVQPASIMYELDGAQATLAPGPLLPRVARTRAGPQTPYQCTLLVALQPAFVQHTQHARIRMRMLAESPAHPLLNPPSTRVGKQRRWDVVQAMDSVGIILYHKGLDAFIIVRQFRPAVYSHRCRAAETAGKTAPPIAEGGELRHTAAAPSTELPAWLPLKPLTAGRITQNGQQGTVLKRPHIQCCNVCRLLMLAAALFSPCSPFRPTLGCRLYV